VITVISPAKSMDFTPIASDVGASGFKQSKKTSMVLEKLRSLSVAQIAKLMDVSEKIAELNYQRFQNFVVLPEKQAIFAYMGDVYKNIDVQNFTTQQLQFAQGHLRIISALYGVLLPLDKIQAYRLEMSCKLPGIGTRGMSEFWKDEITGELNNALKEHRNKYLLNLASNEYFAAINVRKLNAPVINVHFREARKGKLSNIALNSKRARGMMSDYIVKHSLDAPDSIKSFNISGYKFDSSMSDDGNFFFVKR
jgi:hypothetical protein